MNFPSGTGRFLWGLHTTFSSPALHQASPATAPSTCLHRGDAPAPCITFMASSGLPSLVSCLLLGAPQLDAGFQAQSAAEGQSSLPRRAAHPVFDKAQDGAGFQTSPGRRGFSCHEYQPGWGRHRSRGQPGRAAPSPWPRAAAAAAAQGRRQGGRGGAAPRACRSRSRGRRDRGRGRERLSGAGSSDGGGSGAGRARPPARPAQARSRSRRDLCRPRPNRPPHAPAAGRRRRRRSSLGREELQLPGEGRGGAARPIPG